MGAGASLTVDTCSKLQGLSIVGGSALNCQALCTLFVNGVIGASAAFLTYKFLELTIPIIFHYGKDLYDRWYAMARFTISDNLVTMSLLEELKHQYPHMRYANVQRRSDGLNYVPSDGWYQIKDDKGKYLFDINLTENGTKIDVRKYYTTAEELQQQINSVYIGRSAGVEKVSRYGLEQGGWKFAGFRTKIRLEHIIQNESVQNVIKIVTNFRNDTRSHKTLGLFLEGNSRSGKSLMAMLVASEFNMPIYTLPLDSPFMYDALLNQRVGEIPEGSIIFIDEFYQKVMALRSRPNTLITIGGILETLDDQHIPNKCIVILTSISAVDTNKVFNDNLIGPGRIDKVIQMIRPIIN